jgi:hypothetical protein
MKSFATILIAAAILGAATSVKADVNPSTPPQQANAHALRYGKKCILKKGSFIAVSEQSLRRFDELARMPNATERIRKMVRENLVDRMIVDAIAVAVAPRGWASDLVEIHIPGYFGNVFTPRASLDGDVAGYLAAH